MIGRKKLLHLPGDLGGRDHGDLLDQLMPGAAPGLEVRVFQQLKGELHIFCREGFAIMPGHPLAQVHLPGQAVFRDTAIGHGGHFGGQQRVELPLLITVKERVEDGEVNSLIHFHMQQMRVKYRRLLAEAHNNLPRGGPGGLGRAQMGQARQRGRHTGSTEQHQRFAAVQAKSGGGHI